MAKQSKTLLLIASKLGLSEESKVISKAAEFERLLQMKSITSNVTDTAKVVICLDLAAAILGVDLDQTAAIKCSGLKSPTYLNTRKTIENVLELNTDRLTVSALCLMLQCNVQDLAERILEEYKKTAKMELDMNLPQYVCMAVYQACRISKIKVPKSKLIDKSQLKSSQWTKLDADWTKLTDAKFASVVKKKKGKPAKNAASDLEEKMDVDTDVIAETKEEPTEPQIEPYEDWKKRILEAAYRELEKINKNLNKQNNSPSKHKDTFIKQTPGFKQKDTSNKPKDITNKQKDTPNKQKDTPNKRQDISSKLKDTPNKQKDTPNKPKDVYSKLKDIPNKLSDVPYQQNDMTEDQKDNSKKEFRLQFSPRRSPRKTPQKFEPYKSPVKNKGVRLLFPV